MGIEMLLETDGSKANRRNILALAGVMVVAGLAGAEPRDLSVFGVKPVGDRGVIVVSTAAILIQLYWYVLRYLHMEEDGAVEQKPLSGEPIKLLKTKLNPHLVLRRKSVDLFSNWACFLMTVLSWYFALSWIADASFD